MNKLYIELYGTEAELISFEKGQSHMLEFSFADAYDGFITAGGITARVCEGRCVMDIRLMDDGETTPVLICKNSRIPLPKITKLGSAVTPAGVSSDYIRAISLRERKLREIVKRLEEEIEKISRSVYGVTVI